VTNRYNLRVERALPLRTHGARRRLRNVCTLALLTALQANFTAACTLHSPRQPHLEETATGPVDVTADGRRARLRIPASYDLTKRYPLILVLHGYGGTAEWVAEYLHLDEVVDSSSVILALPEGSPDGRGRPSWNANSSCCRGNEIDDVAYLTALVDRLVSRYAIDEKRIYVAGHSNGGFMAHRLACVAPERFAAVASLGGALFANHGECVLGPPIAVLQVHGGLDQSTIYEGGFVDRERDPKPYLGAEEAVAAWAQMKGCTIRNREPELTLNLAEGDLLFESRVTSFPACVRKGAVELWTIEGAGHLPRLGPAFGLALVHFFERNARQ
jgi:polyhydroxybutyrate depolymerase